MRVHWRTMSRQSGDRCKTLRLGAGDGSGAGGPTRHLHERGHQHRHHRQPLPRGRVVQLDPIKPTLKAPGTERLKLQYEELLSNFGFKFNLRRFPVVNNMLTAIKRKKSKDTMILSAVVAGAYTRPLLSST